MRKRVSQTTFELMIDSGFLFDKASHQNLEVVQGYQYSIKEFDFINWVETGRSIKVQVVQVFSLVFSLGDTLSSVENLNRQYKFFKSEITEINL